MLSSSQVISYAVVSGVVIAIPGPSVLFAVGRALSGGRRSALASVVGNALGVYVVAVLVSIGLGAVVARSDVAFDVIKYVGSAYLVYLGARAIANRRKLTTALTAQQPAWGAARSARQGFVVGVANPKALLLFGAVLPQFVDRAAGDVPLQMLLLALVSFFTALLSDSAWVLAASAFRRWFARSPRRLELIGGAGGLAVVVVGITVALTGRRD